MKKFQNGFTLLELLVSVIVLVVTGTVTVAILTSSFRGGSKVNVVNNIRQNGSYAILQMSRAIAYAKTFNGVSTDGVNFISNCVQPAPPAPTPTPTPAQYQAVKITSFDGGETIFSCSSSAIASNSASLLAANSVAVVSCSFTCTQDETADLPLVGINFTLSQEGAGIFAENKTEVPFGTSVTIRNPQR